jgi:hypothetical protein
MPTIAIHVEKPKQPELAEHDSSILGEIEKYDFKSKRFII